MASIASLFISRVALPSSSVEAYGRSCAWKEVRQCIPIAKASLQVPSSELQSKNLYDMPVMNFPWKLVLRLAVWTGTRGGVVYIKAARNPPKMQEA